MTNFRGNSGLFAEAESAYENDEMEKAISLFTTLAESDVPDACMYLGLIYRTGDGVPANDQRARVWYSKYAFLLKRLSEDGNLEALLALGKLYQYGNIVEQNQDKAVELIRRAAEAGSAEAQFHLATQYLYGWSGCPQSEATYRYWLDLAAASKHSEAMFRKGTDLLTDESTASQGRHLIQQAAAQGFWPARDWMTAH